MKLFASYREITGLRETVFELPDGATVEDLLARLLEMHPELGPHETSMIVAVNHEFAAPHAPLHPHDEVAVLPPVSGGGHMCSVQSEPIDPAQVIARVRAPDAGAVVLFLGTVRADPGVKALDYEAYEGMAVAKMGTLRSAARERFGVTEMAIAHRTGRLPVGEVSVAVACSAPHRQAAFEACAWAMDELKKIVPVWKTEKA